MGRRRRAKQRDKRIAILRLFIDTRGKPSDREAMHRMLDAELDRLRADGPVAR